MSGPREFRVQVNGITSRVWQHGSGPPLGFLAGLGGLPRWSPFLQALSERHRVMAPALPGFPGGLGHDKLDDPLDWILAARDLLVESDLAQGDLVGSSFGGMLAAEVAALWPQAVRRLVLIAPLGLYEADDPAADPFAQRPGALPALLCRHPDRYEALTAAPEGVDETDWQVEMIRAQEAAARLLWPLGETGLRKRLGRIACPTLLLQGKDDRLLPPSHADRFAALLGGPVEIARVPGAGHLAEVDAPEATAKLVADFLARD